MQLVFCNSRKEMNKEIIFNNTHVHDFPQGKAIVISCDRKKYCYF